MNIINDMMSLMLVLKPLDHPQKTLLSIFVAWKSILLVVAACSPGPGYDTSTTLSQPYEGIADPTRVIALLRLICTKLTRWDAIYFTQIASRGYVYEQEWAFGWGFTKLIGLFASDLRAVGFHSYEFLESFVGITLAHAAHGLSVVALYGLTEVIFPAVYRKKIAFIAACLHIFSPAGLFLSAPYGESTFSFLSFWGYLLFVRSFDIDNGGTTVGDSLIAISGFVLGIAATIRSNGLLNGILFLEEAARVIYSTKHGITVPLIRRLIAAIVGGVFVAVGFILPQYIAFQEFCGDSSVTHDTPLRDWCDDIIPSIYGFVQSHYWNVGFLRYWTLSNAPLFALATPMLSIMIASSLWAMGTLQHHSNRDPSSNPEHGVSSRLLRSLAIPQLVLAVLAVTSYHVQIITRISSGYCVWYFWLASRLVGKPASRSKEQSQGQEGIGATWKTFNATVVVLYMIVYAVVQAGLFSSFLPPA